MKKMMHWLSLLIVLFALGGGVMVLAGLVPIRASSGHLPVTAWALEFAMERSVTTQSSGIVAPPLESQAMVIRGAAHYDVGCLWCHGAPQSQPPRVALQMTPHPPELASEIKKWKPEQLFYIVRHGVKFTGMPAWPSPHRDDEVWAVVAFLQRFPEMSSSEYEQLSGRGLRDAQREASRSPSSRESSQAPLPPTLAVERCVACHGADGQGGEAHPKLAGQWSEYLVAALRAYREGQRHSGTMGPIAATLSDADIEEVARYYRALDPGSTTGLETGAVTAHEKESDPEARTSAQLRSEMRILGEKIARDGLLKERAGACNECHSRQERERDQRYPNLAGQNEEFLVQQLRLFREGHRGGSDHAHIMHNIAQALTDEQIAAVAAYYAQQRPQTKQPANTN